MRSRFPRPVSFTRLLLALACSLASAANGDTVVLVNGDHISGEILSLSASKLIIKPPYAGRISIQRHALQTLTTDTPKLWMVKQQTISGRIESSSQAGQVVINSQTFALADLSLDHTTAAQRWHTSGNLESSLDVDKDKKDKEKLRIEGELSLQSEDWRHELKSKFRRERENHKLTEDTFDASYALDYFLNKHWLTRADFTYRQEPLQLNSQYSMVGLGPGYRLWGEARNKLDAILTYNHIWLDSDLLNTRFNAWNLTLDFRHYWLDSKLETYASLNMALPDWFLIESIASYEAGLRYRLTRHLYLSFKYDLNETRYSVGTIENSNYILGAGINF
jgi:hypothetical protein